MSPKQTFFGWNRNTSNIQDIVNNEEVETDILETEVFGHIDNEDAKRLDEFNESNRKTIFSPEQKFWIIHFVNSLFWRIPKTDKQVDIIFDSLSPAQLGFKLTDNKTGQSNNEKAKKLLGLEMFRKTYRTAIPMLQAEKWNKLTRHPLIVFSQSSKRSFLCSGFPIILENPNSLNLYSCSFIFPISKSKMFFFMNHKGTVKEVKPEIALKIDMLLFLDSKEMVCCAQKDYLQTLSEITKMFDGDVLRKEIFAEFQNSKDCY